MRINVVAVAALLAFGCSDSDDGKSNSAMTGSGSGGTATAQSGSGGQATVAQGGSTTGSTLTGGSAASDPDGGAGGLSSSGTNFGDPCLANSDCSTPMDWCAVKPGEAQGVCTRQGCKADATICPDQWTCMDLSVFAAGLPAICVK
jgi:hypothetical protein